MDNIQYGARKFNQESYNKNDGYAKNKFINFIESRGHVVLNSEENFDHDIITEKNGLKYHFELEVKRNYPFTSKKTYKFNTVSFLGRKKRLHLKHNFHYIIICIETEWAVYCGSEDIFIDDILKIYK